MVSAHLACNPIGDIMACANWDNGACLIGVGGGRPTHGVCVICSHNTDKAWHENQITIFQAQSSSLVPLIVSQPHTQAIPRAQWPKWAVRLSGLSKPEDTGLGDVLSRKLGDNGKRFQRVFKRIFRKDCGCTSRQARMNAMYPLKD